MLFDEELARMFLGPLARARYGSADPETACGGGCLPLDRIMAEVAGAGRGRWSRDLVRKMADVLLGLRFIRKCGVEGDGMDDIWITDAGIIYFDYTLEIFWDKDDPEPYPNLVQTKYSGGWIDGFNAGGTSFQMAIADLRAAQERARQKASAAGPDEGEGLLDWADAIFRDPPEMVDLSGLIRILGRRGRAR